MSNDIWQMIPSSTSPRFPFFVCCQNCQLRQPNLACDSSIS